MSTQRSQKAEAILAAAEELFAEHGFDGVSMSAVAKRAAVSKANLFYHFGNKDELYYAVLREARVQLTGRLIAIAEGQQPDVGKGLREVATTYLNNIMEHEQLARVLLREALVRPPGRSKDLAEKVFGENFARLVEFLRNGQDLGALRADVDPAAAVSLLVAACVFFFQSRDILRHMPDVNFADKPDAFVDQLTDILLHGLYSNNEEIS